MLKLVGGRDGLLAKAEAAFREGDYQWAAELADHLLADNESDTDALALKSKALRALGVRQRSANARNYYISSANQLESKAARLKRKN